MLFINLSIIIPTTQQLSEAKVEQTLSAENAAPDIAEELGVDAGDALLSIVRHSCDANGNVVEGFETGQRVWFLQPIGSSKQLSEDLRKTAAITSHWDRFRRSIHRRVCVATPALRLPATTRFTSLCSRTGRSNG